MHRKPETIVFTPTPEVSCKFSLQPFLDHFSTDCLSFLFRHIFGILGYAIGPPCPNIKWCTVIMKEEIWNCILTHHFPGLLHLWFADDLCFKCFQMTQQWKQLAFAWPSFNPSSNKQQFVGFFYWSDLISAGVLLHSLPLGDLRLRWRSRSMERIKMGGTSKYPFSEKMMINHRVL